MTVVVPNAIALAGIVDGSSIVASDHRNNYSAVQVGVNGLIAMFTAAPTKGDLIVSAGGGSFDRAAVGANGTVLTADSAQTLGVKWASATLADLGFAQLTAASTSIVSTTESAGTSIVSASYTSDGSDVWVEFFCPATTSVQVAGGFSIFSLFDGATQLGRLATVTTPQAAQMVVPVYGRRKVVAPSAGAHTYSITAFVSATTGTPAVLAGTGSGAGAYAPAFIRIWKA